MLLALAPPPSPDPSRQRLSARDAVIPGTFSMVKPSGHVKQRLWSSTALASLLVRSTSSNCNCASLVRIAEQHPWRPPRT